MYIVFREWDKEKICTLCSESGIKRKKVCTLCSESGIKRKYVHCVQKVG